MVVVPLLSWLWDILVAIMVSVPGPLILKVLFVIASAVVLEGSWLRLCHLRCVFSQPIVDQSLLLYGIDVHIVNRR